MDAFNHFYALLMMTITSNNITSDKTRLWIRIMAKLLIYQKQLHNCHTPTISSPPYHFYKTTQVNLTSSRDQTKILKNWNQCYCCSCYDLILTIIMLFLYNKLNIANYHN